MKIIEYVTVKGHGEDKLDKGVAKLMAKGYQPYGNPYLAYIGLCPSTNQAMVKYENN